MRANPIVDPRIKSPDVQYKDYVIQNNSNQIQLAKRDITYSSPIIQSCRDYYLYISRFSISHMSIPLYFFDGVGQDLTSQKYSVTINDSRAFLRYGLATNNIGDYSSFQYSQPVIYYEQFVKMINDALERAYADANIPGNPGVPFVQYSPNDEKFTLYFKSAFLNNTISFSAPLFQQIQFWKAKFNGLSQPNGKDYTIILEDYGFGLNTYIDPNNIANVFLYIQQERSALYLLNDIQNIAFISNKIPTTKEYVPNLQNSTVLTSRSILCNFIPDLGQGRNLSQYQYYPQGFPGLINMESDQPLSAIDVQLYFVTREGQFFPLFLEPSESVSIRFAFYKKSLFNNNYTSLFTDKSSIGY